MEYESRTTIAVRVLDGMGHVKKVVHQFDFDNVDEAINYFKAQLTHIEQHSQIELIVNRQIH